MNPHMKTSSLLLTWACVGFAAFIIVFPSKGSCQQGSQDVSKLLFSSAHSNASCELGAIFTEFAIELRNNPDARGYIVIYTGHNDPPGLFYRHALGARNVLVNEQHIAREQLIIINGGNRQGFIAEYWLVPKEVAPQVIGSPWQPELQGSHSGKFDEFYWNDEAEDLYEYRRASTRLSGFAQALGKKPDAVGYVIGYADGDRVVRSHLEQTDDGQKEVRRSFRMTGKEVAAWVKNGLSELGVKPSKIVTIDGGYREFATVELWVVPKGGKVPQPTPAVRRKRSN